MLSDKTPASSCTWPASSFLKPQLLFEQEMQSSLSQGRSHRAPVVNQHSIPSNCLNSRRHTLFPSCTSARKATPILTRLSSGSEAHGSFVKQRRHPIQFKSVLNCSLCQDRGTPKAQANIMQREACNGESVCLNNANKSSTYIARKWPP